MAASLIQARTGQNTSTTTLSITTTSNTVTGDMLFLAIIGNTATDRISGVTATGASFAKIAGISNTIGGGAASRISVWYAFNVTGATTPTVAIAKSATWAIQAVLFHIRGLTTTDPLDKTASAGGTTTAISSGATATLTQADEYVIGIGASDAGGATYTVGATYGNLNQIAAAAGDIAMQSKAVAATTAVTSTMTLSATSDQIGAVATFKVASTVTATSISTALMMGV